MNGNVSLPVDNAVYLLNGHSHAKIVLFSTAPSFQCKFIQRLVALVPASGDEDGISQIHK